MHLMRFRHVHSDAHIAFASFLDMYSIFMAVCTYTCAHMALAQLRVLLAPLYNAAMILS